MASQSPLDQVSIEELRSKLSSIKKVHAVIVGIFVVIILAWIILGHWKENVPVFITTITMTVAITGALFASRSGLVKEIQMRENDRTEAEHADEH